MESPLLPLSPVNSNTPNKSANLSKYGISSRKHILRIASWGASTKSSYLIIGTPSYVRRKARYLLQYSSKFDGLKCTQLFASRERKLSRGWRTVTTERMANLDETIALKLGRSGISL